MLNVIDDNAIENFPGRGSSEHLYHSEQRQTHPGQITSLFAAKQRYDRCACDMLIWCGRLVVRLSFVLLVTFAGGVLNGADPAFFLVGLIGTTTFLALEAVFRDVWKGARR